MKVQVLAVISDKIFKIETQKRNLITYLISFIYVMVGILI